MDLDIFISTTTSPYALSTGYVEVITEQCRLSGPQYMNANVPSVPSTLTADMMSSFAMAGRISSNEILFEGNGVCVYVFMCLCFNVYIRNM